MGSCSLFSLALCFLVLFNCCFAQIEQVTSQHGQQCQLDRINALEPSRKIKSEAGVTEIWDENDRQFQCAGVVLIRHKINNRGLLGVHGAVIPGCPETFQSSGQYSRDRRGRESSEDQHQKVRQVREGDVVALPAGVADWFYNNGDSPLVLVQLLDTSNDANQLDQDFRKFFLAGNPQQELQSQRSSYQRGRYEGEGGSPRRQHERYRNILSGFDERILAEAFNVDTSLARRMKNENDNRGIIVRVQHELQMVSPPESLEEEEREQEYQRSPGRGRNGLEETFCTARLKHNINDPESADVFNPRAGRLATANSLNLPILRHVRLSAQRGVLYPNALMSPSWNINAHSICYITRGSGRIQIVGDNGQAVFDGQVREGQVITAPQNFAVVKKAGIQGLQWVSFKTNDHAQVSQLAGRVSVVRAIPDDVLANAFQISREDAGRLKNSREEASVFSSSQQSRHGRD
ncbi:unnamed protein product [Dovyalis caffra]|uniref:Cupin type-1 domain-containing protein n=1 Tax=Dovyalis caffra TaxID=77055 RepID=A0AAV1R682_9ROSI|nr:unnamed protein product [Dovyalis caffra]